MIIVEALNEILAAMVSDGILSARVYQTPSRANVVADYSVTPLAVFTCLTERTITTDGIVRESARCVVDFVDRTETLGFDGEAAEAVIDTMAAKAEDFLARIEEDGRLSTEDAVTITSLYDFMDANTTGVRMVMQVKERQGHCLSMIEPGTDEDNQ